VQTLPCLSKLIETNLEISQLPTVIAVKQTFPSCSCL